MNEKESFIDQYEHIRKLELLTDDELLKLKKKRGFFETTIQNASEIRPFLDYIKYEVALMKKFRHMDYEDEEDSQKIDYELTKHVKNLFRLALKRFQEKRKLWQQYISFCKQKSFGGVSRIYEDMLRFHHTTEDYIEAAEHEVTRKNFDIAMNILMQGIGRHQEHSEKLVAFYIECSIHHGDDLDDEEKEATVVQASKFYSKFLENSSDIELQCNLLRKIQNFKYSTSFQNHVLGNLMENSKDKAEVWNLLALRHLDGIIFDEVQESAEKKVPFDDCLDQAIKIYEKSLDSVSDKKKMFIFFIDKLLKLDERQGLSSISLKIIRRTLGRVMTRGFEEKSLSDQHFIYFLKLRMFNLEKNREKIEEMMEIGQKLYPNSMEFCEIAVRYYLEIENHEKITQIFKNAVAANENQAVELYKFLCAIYLAKSENKGKAQAAMVEAVNSENKKLSDAFQPYYLEFHGLTDGISKAREIFNHMIANKTTRSLSVDFLKMMIKLEDEQEEPDEKMIKNCYERATEHFGKENYEIWIDYIKYLWKSGQSSQADELRKRAMTNLKHDLDLVREFELKFTLLRNEGWMET